METAQGFHLELRLEDASGYRHYLDGRPVHAGTIVEILTDDGWVTGRYEWNFAIDSEPFVVTNSEHNRAFLLDANSLLRWPH